jgi:hypothetical protein
MLSAVVSPDAPDVRAVTDEVVGALKFCGDHNSEDRWQLRWKIPQGFGGLSGYAACDPQIWLAVTTTSLDDATRAGTRFSPMLNLRVFQHRVMGGSSSI